MWYSQRIFTSISNMLATSCSMASKRGRFNCNFEETRVLHRNNCVLCPCNLLRMPRLLVFYDGCDLKAHAPYILDLYPIVPQTVKYCYTICTDLRKWMILYDALHSNGIPSTGARGQKKGMNAVFSILNDALISSLARSFQTWTVSQLTTRTSLMSTSGLWCCKEN